jgi:hypothetical protein
MWDVRTTHGMQYFLARASWDTDGVRDDLRDYVIGASGDSDAILVVDESGDLKKAVHTVGCSASTPAPPDMSRTRSSRCTSSTPDGVGRWGQLTGEPDPDSPHPVGPDHRRTPGPVLVDTARGSVPPGCRIG